MRAGGPSFGAARGKNLIVVQVESLQDFVVDFAIGGQDVMPHLRRWTADSLRFTNVTDQTSEGRTSDAEFTTMASLLPLDHGAVAFRFPGNHYTALPRVLTEHGYATLSAVPFEPGFWNRQVMHPSYGFQHSLFEPDFQMTEQIGWGLNDHDFLQQMVPRIEKLPRPFAAWLITLSLHHPFESFPDAHKVLKLGALEGTSFGNYLHTMRFFDQALEDFKTALARDGLLDDSAARRLRRSRRRLRAATRRWRARSGSAPTPRPGRSTTGCRCLSGQVGQVGRREAGRERSASI